MKTRRPTLLSLTFCCAAACTARATVGEPDKNQLMSAAGTVDRSSWDALCKMHGAAEGCDLCEELGWYDDATCDHFCPLADPDCSEGSCNDLPRAQMTATATSWEPQHEAQLALDTAAATFWHTPWDPVTYGPTTSLPQSITLSLGALTTVASLRYTPPAQENPNGIITSYVIAVSTNGGTFTEVARGTWAEDATQKIVSFDAVPAAYVRLEALEGYGGFAAAGELAVAGCAGPAPDDPGPGSGGSAPLQGNVVHVNGLDSNAIDAANAAAGSGDTVYFEPGTYTLSRTITLAAGVLYHAEAGVTLLNESAGFAMSGDGTSDVIVDGFTINHGAGILLQGGSGQVIINNTIRNNDLSEFGQYALFILGSTDVRIDHNTFVDDIQALMFYNVSDFAFTNNTVRRTGGNGVSGVLEDGQTHTGIIFDGNVFEDIGRMGIELIDGEGLTFLDGLSITNNRLGIMGLGPTGENIAISVVPCHSRGGILIADNVITGTTGWGIEVCTPNGRVERNTMANPTGIAIACSPGLSISDNVFTNIIEAPFIQDGGYCGGETVGTNMVNGVEMTGSGW